MLIGILVAAWIYRDELQAAWHKLLDELRDLWDWWFGNKKAAEISAAATAEPIAPPRTFSSYIDPFASGDAHGMSWPQLVRYTFEALEAWGRERSCPRNSGQTPHEFATALAHTSRKSPPAQTARRLVRAACLRSESGRAGWLEPLRQLWTARRRR